MHHPFETHRSGRPTLAPLAIASLGAFPNLGSAPLSGWLFLYRHRPLACGCSLHASMSAFHTPRTAPRATGNWKQLSPYPGGVGQGKGLLYLTGFFFLRRRSGQKRKKGALHRAMDRWHAAALHGRRGSHYFMVHKPAKSGGERNSPREKRALERWRA